MAHSAMPQAWAQHSSVPGRADGYNAQDLGAGLGPLWLPKPSRAARQVRCTHTHVHIHTAMLTYSGNRAETHVCTHMWTHI